MPLLTKEQLLERVGSAIIESGWKVLYLNDSHPFRLAMYREAESHKLLVYIWNVTHGGGSARPIDEYRIQATGVGHFEQEPGVSTLILGWWQDEGVFAAFDVRKHAGRISESPSLQIRRTYLEAAGANGLAACDKGNQELAVAFRPDFFAEYVRNLEKLHDFGQSVEDTVALETVAAQPDVSVDELAVSSPARRTVVAAVSRKLRDSRFRKRVLLAYRHRCAFCGIQLDLIDAAHTVPVSHEASVDETCNALAVCAQHHRAFDQSLLTLRLDYSVRHNAAKIAQLKAGDRDGGLDGFLKGLHTHIEIPHRRSDRPHPTFINLANQIRGWPEAD